MFFCCTHLTVKGQCALWIANLTIITVFVRSIVPVQHSMSLEIGLVKSEKLTLQI